jgi:hypothetical protein
MKSTRKVHCLVWSLSYNGNQPNSLAHVVVRLLREEVTKLLEPGSYVGEVLSLDLSRPLPYLVFHTLLPFPFSF